MEYQYIPYIWPLILSGCITLSLGVHAMLRRRKAKGANSFILSMVVITIWSFANGLEMAGTTFYSKLFWANIQYIAYCYSPVTLMFLCLEFTGYDRWIRNGRALWLAVIPTLIIILVWTDGLHGLIRYDMHMDYSGSFPVISKKYGPAFFIHAFYSQLLNIMAWILLIKAVFFKNTVYRKQALSLFFGLSLIVIPNILYISGLSPVKRFDITPIFFGPAGLIAFWGIFRYKLFDVIPVARATVIETMDAGVIVLDLQDRVLDINPAFEKIVGYTASRAATRPVEEVCGEIPELLGACKDRHVSQTEFSIHTGEKQRVYEVMLFPLNGRKGALIGRLAVIYEITEKKQVQKAFLEQQWTLAVIEERERMARDMHDDLGQVLGFISLQAQGIKQELKNAGNNSVSDELEKLAHAAQSAHRDIREYIHSVRNEKHREKDFITALKKELSSFEKQTGLRVRLEIPGELTMEEFMPNTRIHILNIVKEALNNIRKHAEAHHTGIIFLLEEDQLCITIEDDGRGFDVNHQDNSINGKFGLNIMRERAAEIGAAIEINSTVGKGSRTILRVPITEEG
ncbi:MAG: histidine kinase N-terminal 7TM domain-containing protein [Thermotaleaceae bacterium]